MPSPPKPTRTKKGSKKVSIRKATASIARLRSNPLQKLKNLLEKEIPGAYKPNHRAQSPLIKRVVTTKDGKTIYIHRYDIAHEMPLHAHELEMMAFHGRIPSEEGGAGGEQHARRYMRMCWPELQWNPWLEDMVESLSNDEYAHSVKTDRDLTKWSHARFIAWTGCGAAGKTFAAGRYAYAWWSVAPQRSVVILTSTTKEMIGKRIWPVIQSAFHTRINPETNVYEPIGHLIDSRKIIQATPGDDKHSISAVAVAHGETQKAIENLKGQHADRMLLVIDEANETPEAIFETITNMRKGCRDFTVLFIGNAVSQLDNHGKACTPKKGWDSITIEDEQWETMGVPKWDVDSGIARHYDGFKSPNIMLGKTTWPFIYTCENYDRDIKSGKKDDYKFWSQTRGFWPPEGVSNTVLTLTIVRKYGCDQISTFRSTRRTVAFLDPAFGGDDCVLQFADVGDDEHGTFVVQLRSPILLVGDATSPDELDYQLAQQAISLCREHRVRPSHFGTDSTGTGRGVAAIIAQEWSQEIVKTEFGGSPSDLPAGEDDPRPSKEVYHNRVTELWWSVRVYAMAGQLRGLYPQAIEQLCSRRYSHKNKKIVIESKDDYKEHFGRSPDHGDAVAGVIEVVRTLGIAPNIEYAGAGGQSEWDRAAEEAVEPFLCEVL